MMNAGNWVAALAVVALIPTAGAAQGAPPPDPPDAYELSAVEVPPRPLNVPALRKVLRRSYPEELREAGVSGQVELRFRVLENGTVDAPSIAVTLSSDPRFHAAARESVRGLRFSPARVNGRPVRVWVELPIEFYIPGVPDPPADGDSVRARGPGRD